MKYQGKTGFPPTQAELRDHFGFRSLNSVRNHLVLIEKKGYIRLNFGKARGIKLLRLPAPVVQRETVSIPLIGQIAAGQPLLAEQNFEEFIPVSPSFFGGSGIFAIHVVGDSMIGAGILDGDIAVIQRSDNVENGEIGAVLIDQEATLKRVYLLAKSLVLKSENPLFEDLTFEAEPDTLRILGRFRGILRSKTKRRPS